MRHDDRVGISVDELVSYVERAVDQMADIVGVSRQAIHKRVRLGQAVLGRLMAARSNGAIVRLEDMRKARAAGLAAAGIPDRTGSPRELTSGQDQAS